MTLATLTDTWPRCTECNNCSPSCECRECHKPARLPGNPNSIERQPAPGSHPEAGATGQRIGPDGEA